MNANQIHEEIKETNLSFMLLAQQMIRGDRMSAVASFGLSEEMASLVAGLSPAQLLKMSASNMLLCCFRFDERLLLDMVGNYKKDGLFSKSTSADKGMKRMSEVAAA
ncbi:MAG: flagellar transcriptional regulator FlhD [Gallionellaceae bacterium]|nr:MAG: flagellar transcriptional regulator FlhD [Gallionellaceae bacterium]